MSEVMMIAGVAENGVIGANSDMPWHISSDLKYFKRLTMGKPVIMGRKTFGTLGKPLPGRPNIVITRDTSFSAEGIDVAHSLDEAMNCARAHAGRLGEKTIVIMGGGQIYHEAMPFADRLEITEIAASPEGDTRFPDIDPARWREAARVKGERTERDSADFTFVTYLRRKSADSGDTSGA